MQCGVSNGQARATLCSGIISGCNLGSCVLVGEQCPDPERETDDVCEWTDSTPIYKPDDATLASIQSRYGLTATDGAASLAASGALAALAALALAL